MEPIHTQKSTSIKHFPPSTGIKFPSLNFSIGTVAAYLAGVTFLLSSATINAQYGLDKGGDNEVLSYVFMAVAISASVILALTPSAFLMSTARKQWSAASFCALAFLIAGSYSLTAALGASSGVRFSTATTARDFNQQRLRYQTSYDEADAALALLPNTKPAAVIQANIDGKLRDPRTEGCTGEWNGKITKTVCPQVDALRQELAVAKNRATLEKKRDVASQAMTASKPISVANTDSAALADFSSALGFKVDASTWDRWLIVLTVLLIELGSGLSFATGLALRRVDDQAPTVNDTTQTGVRTPTRTPLPSPTQSIPLVTSNARKDSTEHRKSNNHDDDDHGAPNRAATADRIINFLKANGGQARGGQRGLARKINSSLSHYNAVLHELARAGIVRVTVDRLKGTFVELMQPVPVAAYPLPAPTQTQRRRSTWVAAFLCVNDIPKSNEHIQS